MSTLPGFVRAAGEGRWRLLVWVQPGAKADGLAGIYQGALKVRLGAPAVDGKANKALIDFIAGRLELKKSQIQLETGQSGRRKTLLVVSRTEPRWDLVSASAVE
ncbi:MAG TPA: DUF167 domain-containing protein [Desulfovibrio sp.]|nr:DUF167 domain-containing protein [Desulfovibrio sp.]